MEFLKTLQVQEQNMGTSSGAHWFNTETSILSSFSPTDNRLIGKVYTTSEADYHALIKTAQEGFKVWRSWPAPKRGEVVRHLGEKLRILKKPLGQLVSYEMGKSLAEGMGEVQEMIDICDFAVGLSRQLYGLTIQSERQDHRMYEHWQPLGIVGIISAFNFPVAVWSWNAAIAWICGDVCIWKPSEKTPLCAVAVQHIVAEIFKEHGVPEGVSCTIQGNREIGSWLVKDEKVALISATGSTAMGKIVGKLVSERLGRSLLELGGNNAIIISQHADLNLAIPAAVFGAVGTAGQRCTTTRRLIIHSSIFDIVTSKLQKAYSQLKIGDPLDAQYHVGPLIDKAAVDTYLKAIEASKKEGGVFIVEGGVLSGNQYESGCYVKPCIIKVHSDSTIAKHETFAPILYVMTYETIEEAIDIQNNVPQGLSSAIITNHLKESEIFLSYKGSDCGIANVNIGTSGAEIGGAFGGEKETGGGRESGSDAWKNYMRRQTTTINWGNNLPLSQGIKFDLGNA
ncbi:MAG: aldehyde dehydrogenase family protein [Alphaproteobacteria bacterium]|nr:aldehyde dehydrogenase family protein [Alphaproteobacteria bacterium]